MSTANDIYAQLRTAIIEGAYNSGDPLRQDQIAKDYGVSKIPVREALVQLESDGFVEMFSGRGAFVARLSAQQAQEIYLMRMALEPVLLEHAIPVAPATHWLRAGGTLAALETGQMTFLDWHALDYEFHTALYAPAELPTIKKTVANLHSNLARYYRIYETLGTQFHEVSDAEHRTVLEACQAKDIATATSTLKVHLQRSSTFLLDKLASEEIESSDAS